MIHVAIIHARYARAIIEGRKRVELRFSQRRVPPFGGIATGDRLYFKISGGPFAATAMVERVWFLSDLTPDMIADWKVRYREVVGAPAAFWHGARRARHATFIWLRQPEVAHVGPDYLMGRPPRPRCAWYTLPDTADVYPQCLLGDDLRTTG